MDFIRTGSNNLSLEALLSQPVTALLGVSTLTDAALQTLDINTIFDLATSDVFSAAGKILDAGSNTTSVFHQHGSAPADLVRDSVVGGKPVEELQYLPIDALARIPEDQATNLQATLDVKTVRDLAIWPLYKAALQLLNTVYFPDNLVSTNEEPRDLLPTNGDYPTDRVQYTTLIMDSFSQGDNAASIDILSPSFTPLDLSKLTLEDDGFQKIAFGALLTFTQSWYGQGVTLG